MSYLRGPDRNETHLLPATVSDYVPTNSPLRFLDEYVEGLDFAALGFKHAKPAGVGRPSYHPADLLKLYIYGYLQRIRSSRRLEAEAARNLELIWLIRGIRPDFKTIANFRKDNRDVFKKLLKQFNLLCRKLELFGAELVAIDGSKFKAVNNSRRYYTKERLEELTALVERHIEHYVCELDRHDAEAAGVSGVPSREDLEQKVALLKERKGRYAELLGELAEKEEQSLSLTDADARKMKGPHGFVVGYNVQLAVDAKHDLIVATDVVQAAVDSAQLSSLAIAAKKELGVETVQVVADTGYHEARQLEQCEQENIEAYVPESEGTSGKGKDGADIFPKQMFQYAPETDTYTCPAGQTLTRKGSDENHGRKRFIYGNHSACVKCAMRDKCTTAKHRQIRRLVNEAVVERAAARLAKRPEMCAVRKETVEHVFGSIRNWNHDVFLLRGLAKVRAEFNLSALVYNLRRVLNLIPLQDLLKKLAELRPQLKAA